MINLFVTGTDTNVGKTIVSAILAAGINGKYWKPIQTGTSQGSDTNIIQELLGKDSTFPESYRFKAPLSPNHAAELQEQEIDHKNIKLPNSHHPLIIEGAGGLLVPINSNQMIIDLIKVFNTKCILVARSGLGTLNHTLLSLQELNRREIPVLGVVLNGPKNIKNKESIEHFGKTKILLEVEHINLLTRGSLLSIFNKSKLKEVLYEYYS